jgi:hypothetical protein
MRQVIRRARVQIGQPQRWTSAQVEKLNKLVLASEFGDQPVYVRAWPGPSYPDEVVPRQCWIRFNRLPVVQEVKRGFYAVTFSIEQVLDPPVKRATVRRSRSRRDES